MASAKSSSENVDNGLNASATTVDNDHRVEGKVDHAAEEIALAAQPSTTPSPPQMDHGWLCWSQCLAGFLMWINSWGVAQAYGVYQTFYTAEYLVDRSQDELAWIGSVQIFLVLSVGVLAGPATDAGYTNFLVVGGNFLVVFGLMMTSLCTRYWQLMLAQGIVTGLGLGALFTPAVAIIPQYFSKKKGLASGVAATGSGVGGLIFPIVFRQLQPKIGFAWATRVIGFIVLFVGAATVALVRFRNHPGKMRKLFTLDLFREKEYGTYVLGLVITFLGIYVPTYFIGPYALVDNITGPDLAFYLVSVINAGVILGRIVPLALADRVGALTTATALGISAGVVSLCWIAIHSTAGLIVFAAIYGFLSGGVAGIIPLCVMVLTKDLRTFGTRFGMGSFVASVAVLIGNPISGALVTDHHDFTGLQAFGGATVLVGGFLVLLARTFVAGFKMVKA